MMIEMGKRVTFLDAWKDERKTGTVIDYRRSVSNTQHREQDLIGNTSPQSRALDAQPPARQRASWGAIVRRPTLATESCR